MAAPFSAPTEQPEDEVGLDLVLEQRPQHADLERAEVAAAAQHERRPAARATGAEGDRAAAPGAPSSTAGRVVGHD